MLERVSEDPTRVVCPIIDVISMDNFQGATRSVHLLLSVLSPQIQRPLQGNNSGLRLRLVDFDARVPPCQFIFPLAQVELGR